ncbi:MAG: hypothetical protein AB7I35_08700 [Ramlibacter sp.]
MSYIVEIVRPIAKSEVQALVAGDPELVVTAEGEHWIDIAWSTGESTELFALAQGRLTLTTPSDAAFAKGQKIAERLGAAVIGEEDEVPVRPATQGSASVRSAWAGWPILVVALAALLVWKW